MGRVDDRIHFRKRRPADYSKTVRRKSETSFSLNGFLNFKNVKEKTSFSFLFSYRMNQMMKIRTSPKSSVQLGGVVRKQLKASSNQEYKKRMQNQSPVVFIDFFESSIDGKMFAPVTLLLSLLLVALSTAAPFSPFYGGQQSYYPQHQPYYSPYPYAYQGGFSAGYYDPYHYGAYNPYYSPVPFRQQHQNPYSSFYSELLFLLIHPTS